jgi:hypothetical protein
LEKAIGEGIIEIRKEEREIRKKEPWILEVPFPYFLFLFPEILFGT